MSKNKILTFFADPSDIIQAREKLRLTEEELESVTLLHAGKSNPELWYFQSSGEIVNFYRGDIVQ